MMAIALARPSSKLPNLSAIAAEKLGFAPLVRIAARGVANPLDERLAVRIEFARALDRFALGIQDSACALRIRAPDRVIALRTTFDEKLIFTAHGRNPHLVEVLQASPRLRLNPCNNRLPDFKIRELTVGGESVVPTWTVRYCLRSPQPFLRGYSQFTTPWLSNGSFLRVVALNWTYRTVERGGPSPSHNRH